MKKGIAPNRVLIGTRVTIEFREEVSSACEYTRMSSQDFIEDCVRRRIAQLNKKANKPAIFEPIEQDDIAL